MSVGFASTSAFACICGFRSLRSCCTKHKAQSTSLRLASEHSSAVVQFVYDIFLKLNFHSLMHNSQGRMLGTARLVSMEWGVGLFCGSYEIYLECIRNAS